MVTAARRAIERRIELESENPVLMAERIGIEPDPWQADVLKSDAHQMMLLCSRQSGKSTVSSVLGLHKALYTDNSLTLLASPSLRQSQELFRKIKDGLNPLRSTAPGLSAESALRLEFSNGSRIVALPGSEATIRGYSGVDLLIVDEATRVPDELYQAVRPMLAVSGGRIVLLSTPFGKRGFFFHEWAESLDAWLRIKITADKCPRIDREWLARERNLIGDWWYRQEYMCEFVETTDSVFSYDDIARAISPDVKPLFN